MLVCNTCLQPALSTGIYAQSSSLGNYHGGYRVWARNFMDCMRGCRPSTPLNGPPVTSGDASNAAPRPLVDSIDLTGPEDAAPRKRSLSVGLPASLSNAPLSKRRRCVSLSGTTTVTGESEPAANANSHGDGGLSDCDSDVDSSDGSYARYLAERSSAPAKPNKPSLPVKGAGPAHTGAVKRKRGYTQHEWISDAELAELWSVLSQRFVSSFFTSCFTSCNCNYAFLPGRSGNVAAEQSHASSFIRIIHPTLAEAKQSGTLISHFYCYT